MTNPLVEVQRYGQSIWYDNLSRELIVSGELRRLVREDGVRGVTSNPAIFQKAIAGSRDYDAALRALVAQETGDAKALFEALAIQDIQLGCDVLWPVFEESGGADGYVSLEVSPYLANDTEGTVAEALRLHAAVGRENLMIKVPATPEGVPAVEQLIAEGVSVNVTLLFAVDTYQHVLQAYMRGLERRVEAGLPLDATASVASFFVSRIDAAVEKRVAQEIAGGAEGERRAALPRVVNRVAIANAQLAYARFREMLAGERWQALAARGARPQRVLWASTGTKNPALPMNLYVDSLIGRDTINTLPAATLEAFREGGRVRDALGDGGEPVLASARDVLGELESLGISLKEITDQLLTHGCELFSDAFDQLLESVEGKRQALLGPALAAQSLAPGPDLAGAVDDELERWRSQGRVRRLWARDASLWTRGDEAAWLGWLDVLAHWREPGAFEPLERAAALGRESEHVVVLGMGGSSLCPDVLARTFGRQPGFGALRVLDSTVPAQIEALERELDLARSLFVVSSKSGGTIEPNSFKAYFWDRMEATVGAGEAARRFVAVTDPGTALDERAAAEGFALVAHGVPSIGGRFSALSAFGLLPAAAMGLDVRDLLARTRPMVEACAASVPPARSPGVALGVLLGVAARQGRDKLTLATSPGLAALGAWIEQLIAESTGKQGQGIVPVDGEPLGEPARYGADRVFVQLRLAHEDADDARLEALEAAGHPVVRIVLHDVRDLGQEFFRWEIATAVAGAVLELNPFDQPDVEAAKVAARQLMADSEREGALPEATPLGEEAGLRWYGDPELAGAGDLAATLRRHLGRLGAGDYFAINAYLAMEPAVDEPLQALRVRVRDRHGVATTLGYGPRFLHSTGQLHKGGPDRGVFLQITAEDAGTLPVPGEAWPFGLLKDAQALGDFQVLLERGRRALHVRLGADVAAGLEQLRAALAGALGD